ncbi:MAG: hypothetical protein ACOYL6_01450 [Bacteriovoracaceae bacterium]
MSILNTIFLTTISLLLATPVMAGKSKEDHSEVLGLNYTYKPAVEENYYQIKDDKQKTLASLKNMTQEWQLQDEFVKNWHVQSSGMYTTPETTKRSTLIRTFSRFTERKGKEYIKSKRNNSKNSGGPEEKDLTTKGSNYFFSYQTILLKGRAKLEFHNPYFEIYSQYSISGKDQVVVSKLFQDFKFKTSFLYSPMRETSTVTFEKYLTDSITARLSSINLFENKVELLYSTLF